MTACACTLCVGLCVHQATRHLVESVTRQLLEGTQGVQVLYGTTATGLVMQQEEGQPEGSHPAAEGGGRSHKRVTGECEGVERGLRVLWDHQQQALLLDKEAASHKCDRSILQGMWWQCHL